jgi:hypothetical protein
MAQVIDMRRLHMGCGESLRSAFPLAFNLKRRATPTTSRGDRNSVVTRDSTKNQRDENR